MDPVYVSIVSQLIMLILVFLRYRSDRQKDYENAIKKEAALIEIVDSLKKENEKMNKQIEAFTVHTNDRFSLMEQRYNNIAELDKKLTALSTDTQNIVKQLDSTNKYFIEFKDEVLRNMGSVRMVEPGNKRRRVP